MIELGVDSLILCRTKAMVSSFKAVLVLVSAPDLMLSIWTELMKSMPLRNVVSLDKPSHTTSFHPYWEYIEKIFRSGQVASLLKNVMAMCSPSRLSSSNDLGLPASILS